MSELTKLVEIWRQTRSPRAALLVELVSESLPEPDDPPASGRARAAQQAWLARARQDRAEDVPMLLASLTGGTSKQGVERIEAIGDDPRLATGLVALLEQPPFSSRSTQSFWRALLARLVSLADIRHVEVLTDLGANYSPKMPTSVGRWLANQITKTAARLAALANSHAEDWPPLTGPAQTLVEGLEATHRRALSSRVRARAEAGHTELSKERLIDAVRADPLNMAPRLIYIDWLLERGDPLGEVLAAERDGGPSTLDPDSDTDTLGELAAVVSDVGFELGFPAVVSLYNQKAAVAKSVGRPEWATVRELRCAEWTNTDPRTERSLTRIASHEVMRSLRAISGPSMAIMADLIETWGPTRSAAIRHWGVRERRGLTDFEALDPILDQLPGLRGLDLCTLPALPPEPTFERLAKLDTLMLQGSLPIVELLERLDPSTITKLWWQGDRRARPALFTRGAGGKLSRVAIAVVETRPKPGPYPTDSVLRLLETLAPRRFESLTQIPLVSHRPLFARLSSRAIDQAPPPDAAKAIREALAAMPGAPEFELRLA